jgi:hypothetical protein
MTVAMTTEAVTAVIYNHRVHYAYGGDFACVCGWKPPEISSAVWPEYREHVAAAIVAAFGGVDVAWEHAQAAIEDRRFDYTRDEHGDGCCDE